MFQLVYGSEFLELEWENRDDPNTLEAKHNRLSSNGLNAFAQISRIYRFLW